MSAPFLQAHCKNLIVQSKFIIMWITACYLCFVFLKRKSVVPNSFAPTFVGIGNCQRFSICNFSASWRKRPTSAFAWPHYLTVFTVQPCLLDIKVREIHVKVFVFVLRIGSYNEAKAVLTHALIEAKVAIL